MILLAILALVAVIYLAAAIYLSRGIHNHYPIRTDLPKVSIVVPVRNEEDRLPDLLESLCALDYPADRLQIIIANDFSTDRTREIAASFTSRFKCVYEVHDVVDEPDSRLILKTRPLAQGLDHASGEVILMTDADCVVPPEWARTMAGYFANDIGMVCGMTLPHPIRHARNPLTWFETLDWMFLLGACTGMSGKGNPQALIGNNYSISRAAYEEIGTFRALPDGDIDDIVLLRAVNKSNAWKIVYPANHGVMVFTEPLSSLGELVGQRRRWMKGLRHVGWRGRTVLAFGMFSHVTLFFWPFLLGAWSIIPAGLLALGDAAVLIRMIRHYRSRRLAWLIPLYPLFASVYGFLLAINLLFRRKVKWKQREF